MRRLATLGATGCLLGLASSAVAAGGSGNSVVVGGGGNFFGSGKVRTDGTLTVGGQETLFVKGIQRKPKLKLAAFVSPPYDESAECFRFKAGFCIPEPLFRVPGTAKLRTSPKGRATLTFVMPGAVLFENFKDPLRSHPVPFTNGEKVEVDIEGTKKVRNGSVTGPVATTTAVVEVPPAHSLAARSRWALAR